MISCDTNILFAAFEMSRPGHAVARRFLEAQGESPDFALCELSLLELYVLLRNPATARRPLDATQAAGLARPVASRARTAHLPRWK